ncbi:hypothetical protein MHU86_4318 [Fragilaria crotonensis]|nr:hypothetical protein MHU86_4318 [Fragilaria crotonensis]
MSDSSPTRSSYNASQRLDLFLSAAELHEHLPRISRTLVDYTATNRTPIRSDSDNEGECVEAGNGTATEIPPSHHGGRSSTPSHLPSFASLERIPYGSMTMESDENDQRIDFFLKILPRRSSESRIKELRAGFYKKSRSPKSRLFGSFSETGEIRQSYNDLKLLREKQMEDDASS